MRSIVAALLEHNGYVITMAESAEEALQRLREDPAYDLVLSDIMMPQADGLSLLDRICADHPGTPVVMLTAVHDVHVATSAFHRGAVDYLSSPLSAPNCTTSSPAR